MVSKREVIAQLSAVLVEHRDYPDTYFARAAAPLLGRPETEVLEVVRQNAQEFTDGGKLTFHSYRTSCEDLIRFFQDSQEFAVTDLIGFITSHRIGCVYGVLVGREFDAREGKPAE